MLKAYHYRLYPNPKQQEALAKHFGCTRFIYNWGLETKTKHYAKHKTSIAVSKLQARLPQMKHELPWLAEVNAQSLQSALWNLDAAFTNFFRRCQQPEVKHKGYPVFKTRKSRQSFQCPQAVKLDFERQRLSVPKIRDIKAVFSRKFVGKVKTVTISKTPAHRYFVSVLVETPEVAPDKPKMSRDGAVGIDLGLKDFAVLSTGERIPNPRFNKQSEEQRIRKLNRRIARQLRINGKHSRNRGKNCVRRARLCEKLSNRRNDFHHKLSTRLVRENQTLCLETLNVCGMLKNHSVAESIASVGWSDFVRMLEYKCEWYGKNFIRIGRFEPSSRISNCCGCYNKGLTLKDRTWVCPECGKTLDRDINAAQNIRDFALQKQNLIGQVPMDDRELNASGDRTATGKRAVASKSGR